MHHFVSILDIETDLFPWLMDEVSHNLEKSQAARDSKKLHARHVTDLDRFYTDLDRFYLQPSAFRNAHPTITP